MKKCVILAALAVALCAVPVFANTWSLTGDYSSGSNPNGAWQYGAASYMGGPIPSFMFNFAAPAREFRSAGKRARNI